MLKNSFLLISGETGSYDHNSGTKPALGAISY